MVSHKHFLSFLLCFSVFSLSFSFTVPTFAQTTSVMPVRSAILLDLRQTLITADALQSAVSLFVNSTTGASAVFVEPPIILNTNGSLLDALAAVGKLVSNPATFPSVIFLAESADVSIGVSDALKRNATTANITLISGHTSNMNLCDIAANPNTVCVVPRDLLNVRAILEVVSSQLQWYSAAFVYSNGAYGTGVQSVLASQLSVAQTSTTVVTQAYIQATGTSKDDDDLVQQILMYRPVGIVCFMHEDEFQRLRAAIVRAGKKDELFLIGSREALNVQPSLTGSYQPLQKLWGALFVSQYASVYNLVQQEYFMQRYLDNYGAYVVSHLFDGMQALILAGNTSAKAIRSTRFSGLTGTVAFDSITGQRMEASYSLVSKTYTVDQPLVAWSIHDISDEPSMTNFNPTAVHILIPDSPLRSATICVATPNTCSEVESLNALIYVLLQRNKQTSNVHGATTFIPLAINTGAGGVEGLVSLIPVARSCTVLAGPGRGRVALALTPVVNQFAVAQLDFNTAEALFSDRLAYPYFSRSIPQNVFNYLAYGEICAHFGWERVLILAINDQFGTAQVNSMLLSMQQRNVYVEKVYTLTDASKANVVDALNDIYKKAISRVVIVLLPLYGTDAKMWFALFDELTFMQQYIFFLGKELCQYGDTHPTERNKAQSSFCIYPYVPSGVLTKMNTEYNTSGLLDEQKRILTEGGFGSEALRCNLSSIRPGTAFAVDGAYTIIDSVERAVMADVSLNRSANLLPFIRSTSLNNFTGPFKIGSDGNRDFAAFSVNIQIPNATLDIGVWDIRYSPAYRAVSTEKIYWMSNSTETPADTFRDISFILGTTVTASPGTIVLSVLGFVGTIAVFAFCYRHYKMQRLVELSLETNRVPVTEDELRQLRGSVDRKEIGRV